MTERSGGGEVTHPIIDSHLHLWNLDGGGYSWLTPEAGVLHANFEPADAEVELRRSGVDGAVLVQADDTEADTEAMLRAADQNDWVVGVVGWVALTEPSTAARQLDRWQQHPRFCGVRHLVHGEPRDDFLELPPVRETLALLAARGVSFDVPNAWPRHLASVTALASALPDLTVVIDHLAKPPRGRADFADWRAEFERAAERPNTVAKLSGLREPGVGYSVDGLREVWEIALDSFGPERLLWGSDWPITVPDGGYGPTFGVLSSLISELSGWEREAVLGDTAVAVYGLQRSDV
jgi:L-fuconolactonase